MFSGRGLSQSSVVGIEEVQNSIGQFINQNRSQASSENINIPADQDHKLLERIRFTKLHLIQWSVYVIRNREGESRAYKKWSNISYFSLQSTKDCNILAVNALISF
jgi:broad specificity polyphosphatase/5'/3'-nucleotidase SurE